MREMKDSGVEWIREIPKDWHAIPLKRLFRFGKGLGITKADLQERGVPVISYGQVHSKTNSGTMITSDLIRYVSPDKCSNADFARTKTGDFIVADTSEDLDGCGNAVYIDSDCGVYAGYHTIILHSESKSDNRYYGYLFKTDAYRSQIRSKASGVKVLSITQSLLRGVSVIAPPKAVQKSIADYLDSKCSQIDFIVEKTRQEIEKLKEYRQSMIAEAVTKGLDPVVEMKDSGVEWAGHIPNTWGISTINRQGITSSGATPNTDKGSEYYLENSTVPWIRTMDLNGDVVNTCSEMITDRALAKSSCHIYPINTVLVAMYGGKGTIGKNGILGINATTNQAVCAIQCNRSIIPKYLLFQLQALRKYWMKFAAGTRKDPNISQEIVGKMRIVIPSMDEQIQIVSYIESKIQVINVVIEKKQTIIEKLLQYKKSLIYECVTGKKEVPVNA